MRAGHYRACEELVPSRKRVLQRQIMCQWPTERSQAMDGSDERPTILRTFLAGLERQYDEKFTRYPEK